MVEIFKNKTMKRLLQISIAVTLMIGSLLAQNTQTIRGTVYDKESKQPLLGASVVVNGNSSKGAMSNEKGEFKITGVPVGRQSVSISFLGYKNATIDNLIVNKGKEVVLQIEIEENVTAVDEVVIRASNSKDRPVNQMASISSRSFSIEETEKYAGSRGDVARMAMNFAGVSGSNDQRNDIVVRGNSPSGLLWKLDDIEIPNPNHFAENGTTGGPVGMLNNNLMQNSDFMTSAFPAEYGNALSGVFDLKLRNGNNKKHEFLAQIGFNGFEAGAEGPIDSMRGSSYLLNFRYSTLELIAQMVNIGTVGVPKYKDYCAKFNFPVNKGKISFFTLGGWSSISMLDSELDSTEKDKAKDLYSDAGQDLVNGSAMSVSGLSYTRFFSDRSHFKLSVSGLYSEGSTTIDTLDAMNNKFRTLNHTYIEDRVSVNAFINTKYNSRLSTKVGLQVDVLGYNMNTEVFIGKWKQWKTIVDSKKQLFRGMNMYKAYYQASYKFTNNLSINPGLNISYLDFNNTYAIEPRFGASYQFTPDQKLSIGYGMHSKNQTLYSYFFIDDTISKVPTNKDLEFTKSQQFVIGHDFKISSNTRLKTEAYYQHLYNIPVEPRPSSYTTLNTGDGWGMWLEDSLENKGLGRNYGLEFTLEQFLNHGFYYLATLSLFEAKAKGSDNVWRNTAFNNQVVGNLLLGYEYPINELMSINSDIKLTFAGAKPYTPLDTAQSRIKGETVLQYDKLYSQLFDKDFFKLDLKLGFKMQSKNSAVTQEWQVSFENLTNQKNPFMISYNANKNKEEITYQMPMFFYALWRINF